MATIAINGNSMKGHTCCYENCPEPANIHIGANGNPDTHWICRTHLAKWNADRARFIKDGMGCDMEELGELR